MKRIILALLAGTFINGAILTSCNSPSEKVENAQKNVNEANKDLEKANGEYQAEIQSYRKETADKIAANDKSIAEFKARVAYEKEDAKTDYKNKVAELEQRNSDMKKKMDDYKVESKEKWEAFKADFSHGMDELGKSFTNLTAKNGK